ncbi:MAG: trimethylamine methyltransferase MttB [Anaerolineae bacterium]
MRTQLQVLSEDERDQIHERTLKILATTGLKVETARGRQILSQAGAEVDENTEIVRLPRDLVEEALRLAPKNFVLGARRPGWDLHMNERDCTLLIDSEAIFVLDRETWERRPGTHQDWLEATRLIDYVDEIGVYWSMIYESGEGEDTIAEWVAYWCELFRNFSKHVQDMIETPEQAPWLLEVLQVVFGDRETIRRKHPLSYLLCPRSPLVIEGPYTDAYLALLGWDIPVAAMPMPLMGGTAPASPLSTILLGNCEVLGLLCLVQAAAPGTPFIYAPALGTMDPRSGRYSGGAVEQGVLGAAATEMARYYRLPVEASGIGSDHYVPGIQASYERALNGILPVLAWPDILVGPGLLGGSMNLCLEQLLIDVEIFKMAKQARAGILADESTWLDDVICQVGPGGHFLAEPSTVEGIRKGRWYISNLGVHDTFENWEAAGRPTLMDQAYETVEEILATHQPLPLEEEVERELDRILRRAQMAT